MKIRALMLLVAMFGLSLAVSAQTSRGSVSGTLTDPTGAVISGATVTLINLETTVSRTTVSNDEGFYRFEAVDPGNYEVRFTASGFGEVVKTNTPVEGGQSIEVGAQLAPGGQQVTVDVTAEGTALLQTEAPVRGGNIETKRVTDLPYVGRNPAALALTLPGVSSNRGSQGVGTFSVNGARGRSNNFLIDGTENNDISVAGQGFQITNPDAVQEVSVQTSNFDAEFGRAGGAVINIITKGGTNDFHGTLSFLYDTTRDDAISSLQSRNPDVIARGRNLSATEYIAAGTIGGPVILPGYNGRNRTFFFGAYQQDRARSTSSTSIQSPTAAGRAALAATFGGTSANISNYLAATAQVVGTQNPFFVALGTAGTAADSSTTCSADGVAPAGQRPCIQFGTFVRNYGATYYEPQWQVRVDHKISDNDQLSGRFLWDRQYFPLGGQASLPGFDADYAGRLYNFLVTETHVFSPTTTNELRLGYNRLQFGFPIADPDGPAGTLPAITIQGAGITGGGGGVVALGVPATFPQGRIANNYVIQDTMTHIRGDHTFRFGIDYLRQISTQTAPSNQRGSLTYTASTGRTSFANFADDFGGTAGTAARDFGTGVYHPQLTRIAFFLQDRWKVTENLTLSLGVRYENFGTPFNALRTPAFTGLFNVDPVTRKGPYSEPNSVHHDQNNFSPSFGIAYSPSYTEGFMGRLLGEKKTVFRAGFQIGYDSFFNNIASNAQASSPNLIATTINSTTSNGPRGLANLSNNFPTVAAQLSPLSAQTLIVPNFVNPYYIRYSAGFQRSLPFNLILDMSYVGTRGVKLFLQEDYNPLVPAALRITPPGVTTGLSNRLDNIQGTRTVRGNGGYSNYHAGQMEVRRRFADNFTFTAAYTFSKFLDNGSEIFGNTSGSNSPAQAVPTAFAPNGLRNEYSLSNFDRTHRASFTYVYELPWFREQRGVLGHLLGGFQIAGVTTFESGVPINVFNNLDADNIGGALDRPLYNPLVNNNVRAVPAVASATVNPCSVAVGATYYTNPDAGNACINPADAEYIGILAGAGFTGNAPRNSERTPGINNTNLNVTKRTRITEDKSIEFRLEFYNVFNHPQFVQSPVNVLANVFGVVGTGMSSVVTGGVAGRFLNPDTATTDSAARVIRYQIKFIF